MFAFGSSQMGLSNSEQKSRKDPCCLWWEGSKIVFPWANSRGCKSLTVLSRLPQVLSAQTSGGGQSWLPAHPRRACLSQPQSFPFFPHLSIVRISRKFSFMNSVSGSEVKLQQNCGGKKIREESQSSILIRVSVQFYAGAFGNRDSCSLAKQESKVKKQRLSL